MKKKLYKTVIHIEILSEYPIDDMTLTQIIDEGDSGSFSISTLDIIKDKTIKGMRAVKEMVKHGSDIAFFNMDEQGNEMEY